MGYTQVPYLPQVCTVDRWEIVMRFLEFEMFSTTNDHQLNKLGLVTNYELNKTGEIPPRENWSSAHSSHPHSHLWIPRSRSLIRWYRLSPQRRPSIRPSQTTVAVAETAAATNNGPPDPPAPRSQQPEQPAVTTRATVVATTTTMEPVGTIVALLSATLSSKAA